VLLAMVWNAGDAAAHRRQAQSAADAAAHSAATWTSRSTNQITATNLLIVQNASAQVVWLVYHDTAQAVERRLNTDLQRLDALAERIRQERERNEARPNGPDPSVELKLRLEEQAIEIARANLNEQNAAFSQWVGPVASTLLTMTARDFRDRRSEIHDYQQQIAQRTPAVAEEQRSALRDFYQCDLTYALPRLSRPNEQSRRISAPIKSVGGTNIYPIYHGGVAVQPEDPEAAPSTCAAASGAGSTARPSPATTTSASPAISVMCRRAAKSSARSTISGRIFKRRSSAS